MPRATLNFKLTGWKAIVFLLFVGSALVWLGARYLMPARSLPLAAEDAIKVQLRFEYTEQLSARYGMAPDKLPDQKTAEKFADDLKDIEQINLSDVHVRGAWRRRLAKFQVSINGHEPPDQQAIRYMRLAWSPLGIGWTVRPATAASYHLAFW